MVCLLSYQILLFERYFKFLFFQKKPAQAFEQGWAGFHQDMRPVKGLQACLFQGIEETLQLRISL
jgi:hypothetical protein